MSKLITLPFVLSTGAFRCRNGLFMRELLRTNDPTLVAFVTALLSGEDIDCFPMDVHMSILEGSIGVLPQRILVREADLLRARAVLVDNDITPSP